MENIDLTQLAQAGTAFALRAVGAIVFLIVAKLVAGLASRAASASAARGGLEVALGKFLGSVAGALVMILAVLSCLGMFGIETTSFAAVLGAAGLAIGLAFQGTLGNLASGVLLLVLRPFKIGDVVNVAGITGKVVEIQLFAVSLDTPDNRRIFVGNAQALGGVIENVSFHGTRRVDVAVGCAYDADLQTTRDVLLRAAGTVEGVKTDPAPVAVLGGLGASSVDWTVRVWTDAGTFFPVKEQLTEALKNGLDAAGIGIPYNTLDVNLVKQ